MLEIGNRSCGTLLSSFCWIVGEKNHQIYHIKRKQKHCKTLHLNMSGEKPKRSTLYYVPKTIASPIVQIILELNLVPNQVDLVRLGFSDLKTDRVLGINPMGTSPTFVTSGGIHMWESGAVVSWVLNEYDKEFKLHPSPQDSDASAKYLQFQQFITATVYPFASQWFLHTLKPESEQDLEYLATAKSTWSTKIGPILERQVSLNEFIIGDSVSAVDFLIAKPLGNIDSLNELNQFPNLKNLLEKVRTRSTYECSYF